MNIPSSPSDCPRCGAPLPADAPEGLCPRCLGGIPLDTVTHAATSPGAKSEALSPETLAPLFPQLDILGLIGRGGMGVVYKARQKALGRIVALKLLDPGRDRDPAFATRFTHEARLLAGLAHPNIVTVYDFGETDGRYYLLMEFVDGVNLRHAMNADRFTPEQALAIVPPVCDALQYAHERGVVHRDIKPENILLDREGRVKIADFGIAKLIRADASDTDATETRTGTPDYMAPEQRAGASADRRADIWSLGVVLYELLTGELPGALPQPPSRKVRLDVRIDEIVLRALEKSPGLRYETAADLKTKVEKTTREMTANPGIGNSARRDRIYSALSGLGVAVAYVALCGSWRYLPWTNTVFWKAAALVITAAGWLALRSKKTRHRPFAVTAALAFVCSALHALVICAILLVGITFYFPHGGEKNTSYPADYIMFADRIVFLVIFAAAIGTGYVVNRRAGGTAFPKFIRNGIICSLALLAVNLTATGWVGKLFDKLAERTGVMVYSPFAGLEKTAQSEATLWLINLDSGEHDDYLFQRLDPLQAKSGLEAWTKIRREFRSRHGEAVYRSPVEFTKLPPSKETGGRDAYRLVYRTRFGKDTVESQECLTMVKTPEDWRVLDYTASPEGGPSAVEPNPARTVAVTPPPSIGYLAWADENRNANDSDEWLPDAWTPEGAPVNSESDKRTIGLIYSGLPAYFTDPSKSLYLLLRDVGGDSSRSVVSVIVTDSAKKSAPAKKVQYTLVARAWSQNERKIWTACFVNMGARESIPDKIDVEIEYAEEAWKKEASLIPDTIKSMRLPDGCRMEFRYMGTDRKGDARCGIGVSYKKGYETDVRLVLKNGETLTRYGRMHNSRNNTLDYHFKTSPGEIERIEYFTRHTITKLIPEILLKKPAVIRQNGYDEKITARDWIRLIDENAYEKSWAKAALVFQKAITEADWIKTLNAIRRPLGKVVSRKLLSEESLPLSKGMEEVVMPAMRYRTVFAEGKGAMIETVAISRFADGHEAVSGYYIKPAPAGAGGQ